MHGGARLLTLAALAGLAIPTIASGLDRAAAIGKGTPMLPSALAGPGMAHRNAIEAAQADRNAEAVALARTYLAAAPMDAAASSLLGTLALKRGDIASAERAFHVTGQLGWRDRSTQLFLIAQAQASGDVRVMAERVDALLRTGEPYERMLPFLRLVEATPGGPAALATRLAATPPWAEAYVARTSREADALLSRRMDVITQARAQGMLLDCRWANGAAGLMAQQGRGHFAYAMWQKLGCGGAGPANIGSAAARFEEPNAGADAAVFGWTLTSTADADARFDVAPGQTGGRALYVETRGPGRTTVAQRTILLPSGTYTINWSARGSPGDVMPSFSISAVCYETWTPLTASKAKSRQAGQTGVSLIVPPARCTAQQLRINAVSQGGGTARGWIDAISVTPGGTSATPTDPAGASR